MMNLGDIITVLVGLLTSIVGFYVKKLYSDMDNLKEELHNHKVEDAKEYITRNEMKDVSASLKEDIKDILEPLSNKLQSIEEFLRKRRKEDI
jgi:hypothetical protein